MSAARSAMSRWWAGSRFRRRTRCGAFSCRTGTSASCKGSGRSGIPPERPRQRRPRAVNEGRSATLESDGPVSTQMERRAATAAALTVSARRGVELDFKAFSAIAFVRDPWVDIWRGAAFVGGVDWRADIPEPSLDERAREAVLHACLPKSAQLPAHFPSRRRPGFSRLCSGSGMAPPHRPAWRRSSKLKRESRNLLTSFAPTRSSA